MQVHVTCRLTCQHADLPCASKDWKRYGSSRDFRHDDDSKGIRGARMPLPTGAVVRNRREQMSLRTARRSLQVYPTVQESGGAAGFSGRIETSCDNLLGIPTLGSLLALLQSQAVHTSAWTEARGGGYADSSYGKRKPAKLTVKTTTKAHRFSHHIKVDRELELRKFWKEKRGVENPAFLHRLINFSRIYARFRDMEYMPHTMRDWDAAIERLFSHDRGMQPANDLVRRHPYLLNVKILPLQFAKNAVKGKLPLYDWRAVLRDLRVFVGETAEATAESASPGRRHGKTEKPFTHAKSTGAAFRERTAS